MNGIEHAPGTERGDRQAKFVARRDCALATIVLSVDPSLLYFYRKSRESRGSLEEVNRPVSKVVVGQTSWSSAANCTH